jgi:DNA-binding NarL/FixJ family response regulator
MSKTRVLIADDHGIVRRGLQFILAGEPDLEVVGAASDGREACRLAQELEPDVVIVDIGMPELNGIEACAQMVRRDPYVRVIILSMHSDEIYLMRALTSGAKGYLLKGTADQDVVRAVREVAQGRCFFSPKIAQVLAEDYTQQLKHKGLQDSYELLTEREKEILQLVAEGKSNKEVAVLLNLSPYTVESHRNHILQKLNLHSTVEMVLYAVRKKIIS